MDDGMTLRRFFLDQRMPEQGPPIVLAVDRSEKAPTNTSSQLPRNIQKPCPG